MRAEVDQDPRRGGLGCASGGIRPGGYVDAVDPEAQRRMRLSTCLFRRTVSVGLGWILRTVNTRAPERGQDDLDDEVDRQALSGPVDWSGGVDSLTLRVQGRGWLDLRRCSRVKI